MAARIREQATYDDLVALPDNVIGEIIEGELYASPRPSGWHSIALSVLGMMVGGGYHLGRGGPGGWWILDEPEVHFDRHVFVPDVAGWRRERMPAVPKSHIFTVVPDWICEVLSGTGRIERQKKMPIYGRYKVAYAWIIDLDDQTLEVKKLVNGLWTDVAVFGGDEVVRAEPFEDVEIDLTLVWGAPPS